jgi:hypothetical protein
MSRALLILPLPTAKFFFVLHNTFSSSLHIQLVLICGIREIGAIGMQTCVEHFRVSKHFLQRGDPLVRLVSLPDVEGRRPM